jgi:hypothetical protein
MKIAAATLALACCFSATARAYPPTDTFLRTYRTAKPQEQETMRSVLQYTEEAYAWANADLQSRHLPALYCSPNIVLSGELLFGLIVQLVQDKPGLGAMPFGIVLLLALKKEFPCP